MSFDPTLEYGNAISNAGFPSGKEYIEAVIEDAKKTLPPNTEFSFISWTENGTRQAGWVYNLQTPREQQKLFNPLKPATLRT
jgi:hypothetical protein